VGLPHTLHVEQFSELVQPAVQAVAELHEVLDVVHGWEIYLHEFEEPGLRVWETVASEDLEQVPKVVSRVEGNPVYRIVEHDAGGHEELREPARIDAALGISAEVDAAATEQLDGVGCEDVARVVELAEVELPDAAAAASAEGRQLAARAGEGEAELDEVEHVDVGLEGGVVVVRRRAEGADGAADNARELRVHRDERELVDDVTNQGELLLEVVRPHLPDLHRLVVVAAVGLGDHGGWGI